MKIVFTYLLIHKLGWCKPLHLKREVEEENGWIKPKGWCPLLDRVYREIYK